MTNQKKWLLLSLVVLIAAVYLLPLSVRPAFRPDEMRYWECAREMLSSGHFLTPTLNGAPYYEKPMLGHFLNAVWLYLLGDTLFAARMAGALAGLGTGLMIYFCTKRALGKETALSAALIFLSLPFIHAVSTFVVLDMSLTFFLTGLWCSFYLAWESRQEKWRSLCWLFLCGIFTACAFMTKGLLAFLLPGITIGPFLLIHRNYREMITMLYPILGMAALVLIPWIWAVHAADSQFWYFFLVEEHFQKFASGVTVSDDRSQPFFFYLPVLILCMIPWLLAVPGAILGIRRGRKTGYDFRKENPLLLYALLIVVCPFLFFSIASAKLATYILPLFPWLAIALAIGLTELFRQEDTILRRWLLLPFRYFGLILVLATIPFGIYQLLCEMEVMPPSAVLYGPGRPWALAVASALCLGGTSLAIGWKGIGRNAIIPLLACGLLTGSALGQFVVPDQVLENSAPEELLMEFSEVGRDPGTIVICENGMIASAALFYHRSDILLVGKPGEYSYGMVHREKGRRVIDIEQFPHQLEQGRKEGKRYLLISSSSMRKYGDLPKGSTQMMKKGKYTCLYF